MTPTSATGIYTQINPNFGLVETAEGEVFFVGKRERGNAFDGDSVKIKVIKKEQDGKRAEAEVLQIVKRTEKLLVGRFMKRTKSSFGFVQVVESYVGKDIFVSDRDTLGAKNDDIVTVRVFGDKNKPFGKIHSILGNKGDPGIERRIVLFENGIEEGFPQSVLDEAEKLRAISDISHVTPRSSTTPLSKGEYRRKDLRHECIVTIDGADARDLDDAISVKKLADGGFELGVYIADVAEYVREGTALDREALRRGTSIYLPDRVIPMLPERLSNDLCSLNAGTPKAVLAIIMHLDSAGKVITSRIEEALIESKYRFTYDAVQEMIDGRTREQYTPEILSLLDSGLELKRILDIRRQREGKIEFDFPEVKLVVDADGRVVGINKRDRSESHKVIEEFMILANEEISRFFSTRKIPFLYRVHEAPSEENLTALEGLLLHYGYKVTKETLTPAVIREIMDTLHEKEYRYVLSKNILTSMSKAIYSEEALGHFGLALSYYSHFTSPIRRYPDLQIHRIIKAYLHKELDKKEQERFRKLLPTVAQKTSTTERKAEDIEYKIRDIFIIEYMSDKIGQVFEGTIGSLAEHGIYVELENGVEGLVYIRDLKRHYRLDETAGTLTSLSGGAIYRLGQSVRVRVTKTDKALRRLDFELVS